MSILSDEHASFSYKAFADLVCRFAEGVPALLLRHQQTAPLAFEIEQLRLRESLEARFTMAIIGQMRAGKSTLVNALIGRSLAPVGVTETTATINWFRYGEGEQCDKFRVHWSDGSTVDLPLSEAAGWVGTQENALRTHSLDFFADAPFLRAANLVDTPGSRSVLAEHTEAMQGFLAEKLESETLKYGGRADAIVYVINPVARENDRDLLQFFGDQTRLPGASAYNSIAVVQKWEHLEPDPLHEMELKCCRLRQQLHGKVAAVLPVSGMLALLDAQLKPEQWDQMSLLATASEPQALAAILRAPAFFLRDRPGVAIDIPGRIPLYEAMNWAALRFVVRLAQVHRIADGAVLRRAVHDASGLDHLQHLLQSQFFSLAGLIQASTALRKAWDPCNMGLLRLREAVSARRSQLELGRQSLEILQQLSSYSSGLDRVREYVTGSLSAVASDIERLEATWQELDRFKYIAERNFLLLDADIDSLKSLDAQAEDLSADECGQLRRLFGEQGPAVWMRLGLDDETQLQQEGIEKAWTAHAYWSARQRGASPTVRKLSEHAVDRLATILDYLESIVHG